MSDELTMRGGGASFDDQVFERLLRERIIFLGSEVNDEVTNRICAQMLLLASNDSERDIALWNSSLSLGGLEVLTKSAKECVLANDRLTIGVQCDSLVMIAPHEELMTTCTSRIGGRWNRLACGHLYVVDDTGGMAVNPDIPLGSGRLARVETDVRPDTPGIIGERVRGKLEDQALFVVGSSPDEFAALLKVERAKWEPVIKAAGIAIKE